MPTNSTKRQGRKQRGGRTTSERGADTNTSRPAGDARDASARAGESVVLDQSTVAGSAAREFVSERAWQVLSLLILALAALLRFAALELKPMHHDEGVNGWFLTNLVRDGVYRYDPANYHGPTLYYFALVPAYLLEKVLPFGMSTFAVRAVTALFGVGVVWLALCLRRRAGTLAALSAALLLAVSPGAVYYSRYFIHETLFVFFTLGAVVAALRFYETARAEYLMLAAASAALLFATKETAFISIGVLLLAWGVTLLWERVAPTLVGANDDRAGGRSGGGGARRGAATREGNSGLARFGGAGRVTQLMAGAVVLFVLVNVLFYSSFFNHAQGVTDALETFKIWAKTGGEQHTKPFDTYVRWMLKEEAPILLLGVAGAWLALAARRRGARERFHVFAGAWAFGTLAAYSLVKYKTPWLSLNFTAPMAIVAGYAVQWAHERTRPAPSETAVSTTDGRWWWRSPALALLLAAALFSGYQSLALNFRHYDDERYPYVYAHTRREFRDLVAQIERYAERAGTGRQTPVAVASPDYWPMPWYFRDYKGVAFHGSAARQLDEPIVVGNQTQEPVLRTALGATHRRVGDLYPLRPGVNLILYVRRDLAED